MKIAASLGTGGLIGMLLGLALVVWVKPDTTGGQMILILIMVALGGIVSAVVKMLTSKPAPPKD